MKPRLLESPERALVYEACSALAMIGPLLDSLEGYCIAMSDPQVARPEMRKRVRKARKYLGEARAHLSMLSTGMEEMERAAMTQK
jgi:hypothetical protein